MQIFAQLTKVDEAAHTVEGIIADETLDGAGEIFDYEKSKPYFVDWSQGIAKATEGKSLGNVRVMHGNTVAGITKELNFDDAAKAITVKAHIVDENEWKKTLAGCYTGFSIGGKYADKWADAGDAKKTRYAAKPHEYSLVDMPCNPSAQFTVVKADGAEELRKFDVESGDEALRKWHEDSLAKIAARAGVNPKAGDEKYGDVKFADPENKKYPIDTPAHIRAAWNYINKPHNAGKYSGTDARSIKAKIVAAWKKQIDPEGPPSARKDKPSTKAAGFDCIASALIEKKAGDTVIKAAAELIGKPLEKGMYSVSELACLLERLDCIAGGTQFEAEIEGDHSPLPDELRHAVGELSGILVHMVAEEVEEMNAGHDVDVIELAADGDLKKALADAQTAHTDELKKAADDLAKVTAERDAVTTERDELLKGFGLVQAELKKIKDAAAPPKGAARVVEKTLTGQEPKPEADDAPVLKADGSIDHLATAQKEMRKIYARR